MESINPADGRLVATYPNHDLAAANAIVDRAVATQQAWAQTTFAERSALLNAVADELEGRSAALAELMALEMGKPVRQGRAEAAKCAATCRYYAANAESFLADVPVASDHQRSFVHYEPLGVVLAVMPWNFPLWQVIRFAAPGLMAGNAGVLKHASNVSGCALALEDMFGAAGAPEGLFSTVLMPGAAVNGLIAHPGIAAVTLTGSGPAGRAVAAAAGQQLKKTVLELGGSDPYVVLADADIETAARVCADSRLINSGQSCIAAKRFIVEQPVHDAFVEAFLTRLGAAKVGDPLHEDTDVGPLARADLRDELHDQVLHSVSAGAKLALGGAVPNGDGAFYPPTALVGVRPGMAVFDTETFGPVAAVVAARDSDDAIALANQTVFGLGAAVFTKDLERGAAIAATRLRAGCCFVNTGVASDARLPFGGVGESGYGRELSDIGMKEFLNIKTVVVNP